MFNHLNQPTVIDGQRVAGLRFGDPRVHALLAAIAISRLQPDGFSNRDLRDHLAPLLGLDPDQLTAGRTTYDLRRLRLHGLIKRIPHTHRYRPTASDGGPPGSTPTPTTASAHRHRPHRRPRHHHTLRRALDHLATRSGLPA